MCDKALCFTEMQGMPLYADEDHLNGLGSKIVGERYLAEYGNPLIVEQSGE